MSGILDFHFAIRICVNVFFICFVLPCAAQEVIEGKVLDEETGKSVTGVSILVSGTNMGTITDEHGKFQLKTPEDFQSIVVSCIGYKTLEISELNPEMVIHIVAEVSELNEIIIQGAYTQPVKRTSDAIYTGSALTQQGVELMGTSSVSSIYNAIDLISGIYTEGNDAYGLSEKTVRIRCVKDNFSGMTIDGFPNYGIMPIGARDDLYDVENIEQIAVYKGATPADLGTATGSKGGAIELRHKRPEEKFGVLLNQSAGSDYFSRTFIRVDAGRLKTNTGVFASYSFSRSDKWKGPGNLGPRNNVAIGINQSVARNLTLEVLANYRQIRRHDFRHQTYEETLDPDTFYFQDYNEKRTGIPAEDMYYYDYNGGNFINKDLQTTLIFDPEGKGKLSVKWYLSAEDADYKEGTQKGPRYFVFNRVRDINRTGVIPEYSGTVSGFQYAAGYWFESSANNANVYSYSITEDGLQPVGYSYFTVNDKKSQVHSPYIKCAYTKNRLSFQAGLKYFNFKEPESERYTSLSPTELSNTPDPDLHTKERIYNAFLPTAGIGYEINKTTDVYVNYGKNYMRPYMYSPIISLFVKNQQVFTENGMTLQGIFDQWEMETSDNFDIGIRNKTKKTELSVSAFYARHHNVLASAYDPVVGLDYYQNVGELAARGIDMEFSVMPVDKIMIYFNPTLAKMRYDNELQRSNEDQSEPAGIKGNQSPATPAFSCMSGVSYNTESVYLALKMKHTGSRYGDATNTEKIQGYTLYDFLTKYHITGFLGSKDMTIGLEMKNILNTKYTGGINVSDDSVQGSATYCAGVPFTIVGNLSFKF